MRTRGIKGFLGLLACSWVLTACSLVSMSKTTYYRDKEGRFSTQVFDNITPNQTSNTWLLQQFGKPLWVDKVDHGVAVSTWQFAREQHKRRDLLLLFSHRSTHEESEFLHVISQNDTVVKSWVDAHQHVDVQRVVYYMGLEKPQTPKPQPQPMSAVQEGNNVAKNNSSAPVKAPKDQSGSMPASANATVMNVEDNPASAVDTSIGDGSNTEPTMVEVPKVAPTKTLSAEPLDQGDTQKVSASEKAPNSKKPVEMPQPVSVAPSTEQPAVKTVTTKGQGRVVASTKSEPLESDGAENLYGL